MIFKSILNKTELTEKDTLSSAFVKGIVEGAIDGLIVLGIMKVGEEIIKGVLREELDSRK